MATKKTTTEEKVVAQAKLIIAPRVTEKASMQSNQNAFTFVVRQDATKLSLRDEIKKEYKVTPRAINITNIPRQWTFVRGKIGHAAGFKKAVVFLKKGDTITLS
ncbi:MAG: ribosomal subunit protein large subunit ribosomal protein [Candidatus Parcubacteria bacterium]|jgi:large subunit ribosomal protein L23